MSQKMNVYDFVKYTKEHPSDFRYYCEILIDRYGMIYLARPSHQICAINIAATMNNQTFDEYKKSIPLECSPLHWVVSKENIIAVWYRELIISSKINRFQKKSIRILLDNKILSPVSFMVNITNEYERYLWRQKLFNGEEVVMDEQYVNRIEKLGREFFDATSRDRL